MTAEGIRRMLRQQPFTPFRLVMSSEFDICPLLHVASIEPFTLWDEKTAGGTESTHSIQPRIA